MQVRIENKPYEVLPIEARCELSPAQYRSMQSTGLDISEHVFRENLVALAHELQKNGVLKEGIKRSGESGATTYTSKIYVLVPKEKV